MNGSGSHVSGSILLGLTWDSWCGKGTAALLAFGHASAWFFAFLAGSPKVPSGDIILPNSSRVSLLTYKAIVAVRYPELVLHDQNPTQSGHFVSHDHTVEHGGFRTVLWDAPKDLRTAVEDVVAFLTYLQNRHRDLSQGATAQLLVLCNRTAVHNQLLQHGFQTAWHGVLRITTASSAAGAFFFLSEPVAFRRVCGLESYSRTSGESNHHRQSVSATRVTPYQLSHGGDFLCSRCNCP